MLVLFLFPILVAAQTGSNQFDGGIGIHFYKRKKIETTFSSPYLSVKNGVANSIYFNYLRRTKSRILLLTGVEFGYERFNGEINYPFEQYGYYTPVILGDQYTMNVTTLYARLNIGAGYQFHIKNKPVNILAGMLLQVPLTNEQQYYISEEELASPYIGRHYNFRREAHWGKDYDMGFVFEKLTFFYIGTTLKMKWPLYGYDEYNIGVRVQQNFISPQYPLNAVYIRYNDSFGKPIGDDVYRDNQFAISLMLGVKL